MDAVWCVHPFRNLPLSGLQSLRRNAIAALAIALATLILAEAGTWALMGVSDERFPPREVIQRTLAPGQGDESGVAVRDNSPWWIQGHVIHPFVGYVLNTDLPIHNEAGHPIYVPANPYGYFGPAPLPPAPADTVVVALTGGSVAMELYLEAGDLLARELGRIPAFSGKRIQLVSLALGGMKQPQQLMAMTYFLSLGARFDVIVNLDGFNEMALPANDNVPAGVAPYFPRSWHVYAAKSIDGERLGLASEIGAAREGLARWRRALSNCRFSNLCLALWETVRAGSEARIAALGSAFDQGVDLARLSSQETGPSFTPSAAGLGADLARMWATASVQMARLSGANGIRYFHFLQPNQYVPGSKVFTEVERAKAIAKPDYAYRSLAEQGYPYLLKVGQEMKNAGMPFTDLTGLFREEAGTVYRDRCCHFNRQGYTAIARAIAAGVAEGYPAAEAVPRTAP